jgi:prepilin-type N-terminal cleavage/methylation domain-containing protein
MVPQYMKCLLVTRTSAKGFTLIEMIIGIALTVTVSGLALAALTNAERGFSKDKNVIEGGQKLSSVIDILGRDIVQAGEEINDPKFPVIQVATDSSGARLTIYRGLAEALSLCSSLPTSNALTAGVSVDFLPLTSTNNGVMLENSACIPTAVPTADPAAPLAPIPAPEYPNNVKEWADNRTARGGSLQAFIHNGSGNIQAVTITNETDRTSFQGLGGMRVSSFAPSSNFPNRSTLNLVEKRQYLICGTNLKVRINDSFEDACRPTEIPDSADNASLRTIATNITRLDISTPTSSTTTTAADGSVTTNPADLSPSPNVAFPPVNGTKSWRNLRGVVVNVIARNPDIDINNYAPNISASGRFYPRNILSTNVR